MTCPFTLTIRALGSVALGGVTQVDRTHHLASTRDAEGRPYIPATALRGVLRSALEALLRGAGESACAGGMGLPPDAPAGTPSMPCALGPDGERCAVCRLFGGYRDHLPTDSAFFSALILGDATTTTAPSWSTRPTVGIHRSTRAARDRTLAMHHVPAPESELVFTARGRLLDPALEHYFCAALRAATHVGAGRSRGLGRIELSVEFDAPAPVRPIAIDSDVVHLRLELTAPASLGVPLADDNLRDTRREIPGAALRGAVGFALAEALGTEHSRDRPDSAFERLVAEEGARFSFFYPVDSPVRTSSPLDAAPLPITALACKFRCREHHLVDGLLDALAATDAACVASAGRVATSSSTSRCERCGGPLRSVRGLRSHLSPVKTRTISRLAIDRARGSAKNEMLFTQVLLEPGTMFEGSIHHIPVDARERLALALQQPLSVGRGRASGWGQLRLSLLPPPEVTPLPERAGAFHRALGARLSRAGLHPDAAKRWIALTLLAPLIPADGDEDGSAEIARRLGADVGFKARRFTREGGWDQRTHGMQPALAVAGGGVFAVRLAEGVALSDILETLLTLERDGLGQRRHQGYGAIRCFDPFHCGPLP